MVYHRGTHKPISPIPHYQLPQEPTNLVGSHRLSVAIQGEEQLSQPVPGESDMSGIKNQSRPVNASSRAHNHDSRAHATPLQSKNGESSGTNGHGTTGQRRGTVAVVGGGRLDGSASASGHGANHSRVLSAERRRANLGDGHGAGLAAGQARAGGDWLGGHGFRERADGSSDDNGVRDDGSGGL